MRSVTYTDFIAAFGVGGAHPGGLTLTKKILDGLEITEETNILDVGCGTGQTVDYIAEKYNCNVIGLDNNETMLTKMRNRLKENDFDAKAVHGNVESLPFNDQSFDYVISESVTSFTNILVALKQYARVLKPQGTLIMIEMTKNVDLSQWEMDETKDFYGVTDVLSEREWGHYISLAGFERINTGNVNPLNYNTDVELDYSSDIDAQLVEMMGQHQMMLEKYGSKLGTRIYYCYLS